MQLLNATFEESKRLLRYRYGTAQQHGIGVVYVNAIVIICCEVGAVLAIWHFYQKQQGDLLQVLVAACCLGVLLFFIPLWVKIKYNFKNIAITSGYRNLALNGLVGSYVALSMPFLIAVSCHLITQSIIGYLFLLPQVYFWFRIHSKEYFCLKKLLNGPENSLPSKKKMIWRALAIGFMGTAVTATRLTHYRFIPHNLGMFITIIMINLALIVIIGFALEMQFSQWAESVLLAYYMCKYPEHYRQHLQKSPEEYYGSDWKITVKDPELLASIYAEQAEKEIF